ncbi:hypothetical protein BB559_006951 [Furculomyces boomerangus]|uniref:Uncharacterized protein n=2 Tax=Harpellales TaxID=61421 RepID=A0A2T9XZQ1_9FUNG|nr:hypothetical protein BB559_006951 [Furculomyces boomerangus]PWA01276.1 hypothetical protein BB558_002646 [Smittium angustum]
MTLLCFGKKEKPIVVDKVPPSINLVFDQYEMPDMTQGVQELQNQQDQKELYEPQNTNSTITPPENAFVQKVHRSSTVNLKNDLVNINPPQENTNKHMSHNQFISNDAIEIYKAYVNKHLERATTRNEKNIRIAVVKSIRPSDEIPYQFKSRKTFEMSGENLGYFSRKSQESGKDTIKTFTSNEILSPTTFEHYYNNKNSEEPSRNYKQRTHEIPSIDIPTYDYYKLQRKLSDSEIANRFNTNDINYNSNTKNQSPTSFSSMFKTITSNDNHPINKRINSYKSQSSLSTSLKSQDPVPVPAIYKPAPIATNENKSSNVSNPSPNFPTLLSSPPNSESSTTSVPVSYAQKNGTSIKESNTETGVSSKPQPKVFAKPEDQKKPFANFVNPPKKIDIGNKVNVNKLLKAFEPENSSTNSEKFSFKKNAIPPNSIDQTPNQVKRADSPAAVPNVNASNVSDAQNQITTPAQTYQAPTIPSYIPNNTNLSTKQNNIVNSSPNSGKIRLVKVSSNPGSISDNSAAEKRNSGLSVSNSGETIHVSLDDQKIGNINQKDIESKFTSVEKADTDIVSVE